MKNITFTNKNIAFTNDDDITDPLSNYCVKFTGPQSEFLLKKDAFPLFVGGFGSGKTFTMCACVLRDLIDFDGANVAAYAPTYDLLHMIALPYISEHLENMDLDYSYNGQRQYFKVKGYGKIYCRSLSNPSRIVGYEVFRSHIDELDTLPKDKAELAWNKIIARNRQKIYKRDENGERILKKDFVNDGEIGNKIEEKYELEKNRVSAYTTPEGFLFTYDRWHKNKKPGYSITRAPSYSNPNLPDDYIENLRNTYSEELVEAYIEGNFVNLTSGAVYRSFDRELNSTTEEIKQKDVLHVGMDFNVLYGAAGIHVIRNNCPLLLDEIVDAYDTDDQIDYLNENYSNHSIYIYPDASGDNRTSANTSRSDITKLKKAGFHVIVDHKNPAVKDRIISVNSAFYNRKTGKRNYLVNVEKCPNFADAFEQQVYDKNGKPDKTSGHDHKTDAAGYFIHKKFPVMKPQHSNPSGSISGSY